MNYTKIILQPREQSQSHTYQVEIKALKFMEEINCLTARLSKNKSLIRRFHF